MAAIAYVRSLNALQVDVIRFLDRGDYQASIARRLGRSRAWVNGVVRTLERYRLVVARRFSAVYKGKVHEYSSSDPLCNRVTTYHVTDRLKALLTDNPNRDGTYTLCSPHHLKMKFPIASQDGHIVLDGWRSSRVKAVHVRSWQPRGPARHLFHVDTPGGLVGIEVHGPTLVAYRVDRGHIAARSIDEATQLVVSYIQEAVSRFVEEQSWFGTSLRLGAPSVISRPHYAFASRLGGKLLDLGQQLRSDGLYVDGSPRSHGQPGLGEIETDDPVLADLVDSGLRAALSIDSVIERQLAEHHRAVLGDVRAVVTEVIQDQVFAAPAAPAAPALDAAAVVPDVRAAVQEELATQNVSLMGGLSDHLSSLFLPPLEQIGKTTHAIYAQVTAGQTQQYQLNQLIGLIAQLANALYELKAENASLQGAVAALEKKVQGLRSEGASKGGRKKSDRGGSGRPA